MTDQSKLLAVGFVTFNPGPNLADRIRLLADLGCVAYVFDNSPEFLETSALCKSIGNVRYATAGKNLGLGIGLSSVAAMSYCDGFEFLIAFDQDTAFTAKTLAYILEFCRSHSGDGLSRYVAVTFNGLRDTSLRPFQVEDVVVTITSGSLLNLQNVRKIGWYNEKYFVDGVDYELCLRARRNGYLIGSCSNTPDFDHESEQHYRFLSIFGLKLPLRRYPTFRVKDSIKAHCRLLAYAAMNLDFVAARVVARSFLIFVVGQTLARILPMKAN